MTKLGLACFENARQIRSDDVDEVVQRVWGPRVPCGARVALYTLSLETVNTSTVKIHVNGCQACRIIAVSWLATE